MANAMSFQSILLLPEVFCGTPLVTVNWPPQSSKLMIFTPLYLYTAEDAIDVHAPYFPAALAFWNIYVFRASSENEIRPPRITFAIMLPVSFVQFTHFVIHDGLIAKAK